MGEKIPVIAVFDIGKTHKKLMVFDRQYQVVKESISVFDEITDEEGFPCENLEALSAWLRDQFGQLKNDPRFELKAVNFSTYGASVVYIDAQGKPVGFLYNYLKPYPADLRQQFERDRGGATAFSTAVSTPLMGHLNAGMQLYWLKIKRPELFSRVKHILHFPQYLSFLFTGRKIAEMTSLGCHSAMWNFREKAYHCWLKQEGILEKLSPPATGDQAVQIENDPSGIVAGTGLHDSSAAVIPYLQSFKEPFVILSTGTWAVSLNPFNTQLPDEKELSAGCLSYLTYRGTPVKTSMLFSGNDHDQQVKRIADHFGVSRDFFKDLSIRMDYFRKMKAQNDGTDFQSADSVSGPTTPSKFQARALSRFDTAEEAYHWLVADIIAQQKIGLQMVLKGTEVRTIYVDGGFCRNAIYMQLLANAFTDKRVYSTSMIQGTALGAALAVHNHWNSQPLPENLIQLRHWPVVTDTFKQDPE